MGSMVPHAKIMRKEERVYIKDMLLQYNQHPLDELPDNYACTTRVQNHAELDNQIVHGKSICPRVSMIKPL